MTESNSITHSARDGAIGEQQCIGMTVLTAVRKWHKMPFCFSFGCLDILYLNICHPSVDLWYVRQNSLIIVHFWHGIVNIFLEQRGRKCEG